MFKKYGLEAIWAKHFIGLHAKDGLSHVILKDKMLYENLSNFHLNDLSQTIV